MLVGKKVYNVAAMLVALMVFLMVAKMVVVMDF